MHQIPLPPSASGPTPILSHDPTTTPTTAITTEIMIFHNTDTVINEERVNKGGVANRGDTNGGGVANRGDPIREGVVNRGGNPNSGGVANRGGDPNGGANRGDINGDSNGGVITDRGRDDSSNKAPPSRRDSIEDGSVDPLATQSEAPMATQSGRPKDDSRPTDISNGHQPNIRRDS